MLAVAIAVSVVAADACSDSRDVVASNSTTTVSASTTNALQDAATTIAVPSTTLLGALPTSSTAVTTTLQGATTTAAVAGPSTTDAIQAVPTTAHATVATVAPVVTTTAPFNPALARVLAPAAVAPTCQAPNGAEANGTPVVFSASNLFDGDPTTAWRCAAPATNQRVDITLASSTHVTSVGIIGGYTKTDPTTGADRFLENFRMKTVQWLFDGNISITQNLADSRDLQRLPVNEVTTHISMVIIDTYPPAYTDARRRDFVPASEIELLGVAQ